LSEKGGISSSLDGVVRELGNSSMVGFILGEKRGWEMVCRIVLYLERLGTNGGGDELRKRQTSKRAKLRDYKWRARSYVLFGRRGMNTDGHDLGY